MQARQRFAFAVEEGKPVSLDQKLRETIAGMRFKRRSSIERAEHLSLVTRWHGSSWKQGELLLFDGLDQAPYRKLVRAISRVAAGPSLGSRS